MYPEIAAIDRTSILFPSLRVFAHVPQPETHRAVKSFSNMEWHVLANPITQWCRSIGRLSEAVAFSPG